MPINYFDLVVVVLLVWAAYRGFRQGTQRAFVALLRSILAFALAVLTQARVLELGLLRGAPLELQLAFSGSVALPVGPGTTLEGALRWLQEADLPQVIARSIQHTWSIKDNIDAGVLAQSAGQVLAVAAVNCLCFVSLFLVARWIISILSNAVVKALPPGTLAKGKVIGLSLGIIESIIICVLLVALLAPFMVLSNLPIALPDAYHGSKLIRYLQYVIDFIGDKLYYLT